MFLVMYMCLCGCVYFAEYAHTSLSESTPSSITVVAHEEVGIHQTTYHPGSEVKCPPQIFFTSAKGCCGLQSQGGALSCVLRFPCCMHALSLARI